MITYKLAKQLKEAGFPQEKISREGYYIDNNESISEMCPGGGYVYSPTLSELIEACPKELSQKENFTFDLYYENSKWNASYSWYEEEEYFCEGENPEEAVANLWLKLSTLNV